MDLPQILLASLQGSHPSYSRKVTSLSSLITKTVKNSEGSQILPYLQINKLAWYSSWMVVEGMRPWARHKGQCIAHSNRSSLSNIVFATVL